MKKKNEN